MNVNEMTLDEVRDELARMDGWALEEGEHHEWGPEDRSITTYPAVWIKGDNWITHHPHPPTLDGAAAALPKCAIGVVVEMHPTWHGGKWCARAARGDGKWWVYTWVIWLDSWGHDELTARYRLALACRLAEKGAEQ